MKAEYRQEVWIEFAVIEGDWNFQMFWRGRAIGYAWCDLVHSRLKISDITVEEAVIPPWPICLGFLSYLGLSRRPKSFRGVGLGSRLLDRVLHEADRRGVAETWGGVTKDGMNETPHLLAWYKTRGFQIVETDSECDANAAWKITQKRAVPTV